MNGKTTKREQAKEIILDFLRELYDKKRNQIPLTAREEAYVSQKQNLVAYVYEQDRRPTYTPDDNEKNPVADGIVENPERLVISISSVDKGITELLADGKIEFCNGRYEYRPALDELLYDYPILNIASSLTITPLPVDGVIFFRVRRNYAAEIAEYLNTQFYNDDIYSVSIGDLVVCLDVKLAPASGYVAKKDSIEKRVRRALSHFDIKERSANDSKVEGLTAQEKFFSDLHERRRQHEEGPSDWVTSLFVRKPLKQRGDS